MGATAPYRCSHVAARARAAVSGSPRTARAGIAAVIHITEAATAVFIGSPRIGKRPWATRSRSGRDIQLIESLVLNGPVDCVNDNGPNGHS